MAYLEAHLSFVQPPDKCITGVLHFCLVLLISIILFNAVRLRDNYKQFYANTLSNVEEMNTFLEIQSSKTESGGNRKSEVPMTHNLFSNGQPSGI